MKLFGKSVLYSSIALLVSIFVSVPIEAQVTQRAKEYDFQGKVLLSNTDSPTVATVPNIVYRGSDKVLRIGPVPVDQNNFLSGLTFNSSTKALTATIQGRPSITVNIPYPNQPVLTGAGTVTITGTYPNLTITGSSYSLPPATTTTLGGVRVGTGLSIDGNGILSANAVTVDLTPFVRKDQNLADIPDKAAARSNLGLATVATSGSYNDLTNKPVFPTGTVTSVGLTSSDFTISGSPVTGAGSITANIGANKVTFAKFQQINTGRLIGRSTAGTGNVEEITIGSGLQLVSGVLSATAVGGGGEGTVTSVALASTDLTVSGSPVTGAGTITANIGNNRVTFSKMQQIGTQTLIGRSTAGTGNVESISLGAGLVMSAGTLSAIPYSLPVASAGTLGGVRIGSGLSIDGSGVLSATNSSTGTVTSVGLTSSDFTISGSPVTGAGSITANIGANKVTFAKFQQINTGRLIGRSTAGTGNVEEITIGSGLQLVGGVLSATVVGGGGEGTVTSVALASTDLTVSGSPVTGAGTITANIGNNRVTFAKMQQITAGIILGRSTAGTGNVEAISIGTGLQLAGGVLSATNTSAGTVTSVALASTDLTLSGSPITSAGTITANIGNNRVTFAKMQQIATNSLLGRFNAGTGNVESIAVGSGLTLSAGTLSATPYTLPVASAGTLGGVRIGSGLSIDGSGILSATNTTTGTVTSVGFSSTDLTVSGSPVTAAGTITANIGNNRVTFAKMQQIPTASLLGRSTAGTGNVESISLGPNLTLAGGILNAQDEFEGTVTSVALSSSDFTIAGSPVTTTGTIVANIGVNKVTFAKFQQIPTNTLLGRFNAGTGNVETLIIGTGLAVVDGALVSTVTGGAGGTVTSVGLSSSDLTVSGSPIVTSGTFVANIGNNKVTFAKFQQLNTGRLVGRSTTGIGNAEEISIGSGLTLSAGTLSATPYTLPVASAGTLGGVRIGSGLSIDGSGVLSATNSSTGTVTSVGLTSSDFTISGSPVTGAGSITANIGANKVTFAKFQQISTGRLVGRASAGTGNVEEIAIGPGLTLAGGVLSASETFTGTVTSVALSSSDLTVTGSPITSSGTITANIGNNKVTFAKMQQIPTQTLMGRSTAGTGNVESITVGGGLMLAGGVLSANTTIDGQNLLPLGQAQVLQGKEGNSLLFRSLSNAAGDISFSQSYSNINMDLNGALLKEVFIATNGTSSTHSADIGFLDPRSILVIDLDYTLYSTNSNRSIRSGRLRRSYARNDGGVYDDSDMLEDIYLINAAGGLPPGVSISRTGNTIQLVVGGVFTGISYYCNATYRITKTVTGMD